VRRGTNLGELEEGRAGVDEAVDAVPREQLPPRRVPPHRLGAAPAQHLQHGTRELLESGGALGGGGQEDDVGGPPNLGDAGAQVGEELADGRGVARVGVGGSVQRVREGRARRRFPAARRGRGAVCGRRGAELVGRPAPRGEAGEEHCPSLLAGGCARLPRPTKPTNYSRRCG
jgi:hypothetical protein